MSAIIASEVATSLSTIVTVNNLYILNDGTFYPVSRLFLWVYFGLLFILVFFVLWEFVLPVVIARILFYRPMFLVFPATKEGKVLKKYFKGRIVDDEDESIIDYLTSVGMMKTGVHEVVSEKAIELVQTAKSLPCGISNLKYGRI